jgi:hypothetical protein
VFGVGGFLIPDHAVRNFATFFLQQKQHLFGNEIAASGVMAAKWEKKGTSFIRPGPIEKYPNIKRTIFRVLGRLEKSRGNVFYYGREKIRNQIGLNSNGLYKTVLSHAIRGLDAYCDLIDEKFIIIVDQHSARKELLETAIKTMYGNPACRRLASPPFEVESYANQNIQCADWIATILGRMYAFAFMPNEYADHEKIDRYFGDRIQNLSVRSTCMKRTQPRYQGPLPVFNPPSVPSGFCRCDSDDFR